MRSRGRREQRSRVGELVDPERRGRRRRGFAAPAWCLTLMTALVAALGMSAAGASAQSDTTAVTIPGNPLTVYIGPRGECQSSYLVNGQVAGNYFYGGNAVGDCGFFLAFPTEPAGQSASLKAKTFGFSGAAGPNLTNTYTPVSQTPVSGAGTATSPYTQTTVFKVEQPEGTPFAEIVEVTTYVNGAPQFTSTYTVKNVAVTTIYFRAMYAGDLYVNGNDHGVGVFLGGPPRFIGGQNTGSGVIGGFQEAPAPALPWTSFEEAYWAGEYFEASPGDTGIWHAVETSADQAKAFNGAIEPKELDNGAGVAWDQLRTSPGLPPNESQSFTIINRTQIPAGLQINPANQSRTQGQTAVVTVKAVDTANQPYAGKALRYTVGGANPSSGAVTLNSAGEGQIAYVGKNAGIDTIQMYVDLPGSGVQVTSDPAGSAQVTFVPLPPTPNSTYKIQSIRANSDGTITIVFVPTQSGVATLEVTVPTGTISRNQALAAKRKACKKGLVRIKGKCRPKNTVSGKLSANGIGGVPLTLTVKPSSKVRAALKKGKTVPLTAKLTYKSALGGTPTVQVFHFTVKPKKKHKKH